MSCQQAMKRFSMFVAILEEKLNTNDNATLNTVHILWRNWTNSLWVVDKIVTEPPELSAYQGHKSSTEAEMYCESTAWGRAARALRHPPTLPESAVSVATRVEGGGGRCSVKVKKHVKPIGRMDGWMGGYIEGWVIKGCGRVNGELGLILQHHSHWQIDGQRQTTAASTVRDKHWGVFFFTLNGSTDHGHGSGV